MSGSISKPRTHLYRPKASQQQQLDAVVRTNGAQTRGHLALDQPRPRKRQFDGKSGNNSSPAKKLRLTQTGATGHLRRSTRLRELQRSEDPIPIAPSIHVPLAGRPLANTQQFGIEREEVKQATQFEQQRTPPKHRHTTLPEPKAKGQENVSPATRLQKRQIGSDDNNEHHPKRARLTKENLAVLNKMARKKAKAPAPPESTVESSSTKTTSTTSSGFAIQAYKNGMLEPRHSKPPANLKDIRARHTRSRETASPPESRFKRYINNVEAAPNEATMLFKVGAYMLKEYDDDGYHQVFNQPFTGFPADVGFNNGLSAPQPDFVEGLEMQQFRPFPVDEHVQGAVLYKDNPSSLTLPHLAGEWKGRGKDMKRAMLQSRYDGAALVYTRNQALSSLGESDPPGHAEITTFTTDGTNFNFYAHYAAPTEDGTLEYHQYQYASANVKDSHQGHKDGRRGLRNQQDHAREQSYDLRNRLKEHWTQCRDPIAEGVPDDNFEETNANEAGYEIVEQPCQSTPDASLLSENDYAPSSGGYNRKPSSPSNALPVDELEAAEEQQDGDSDPEFVDCEEYKSDAGEPSMSFATSAPTSFSAQTHTSSKRHRALHSPPSNSQPFKKHGAPRRSARSSTRVSSSTALVAEHPAAVDGYWTWSDEYRQWYHPNEVS